MDVGEVLLIVFVFGGGGFYILRPLAVAIAKRISGDVPSRRQDGELNENVLTELQGLREEVSALAERVDFTERLLAKKRDADRLSPPR